ncbi:MAG: peptide chain release factor N(5)-glutamine methyltransferase [Bacteroidales bacterium]|nr:peptide chain release factor N(5)-glutamine methyltransferase [Bacteroidales bacterium]
MTIEILRKYCRDKLTNIYGQQEASSIVQLVLKHYTGLSLTRLLSNVGREIDADQEINIRNAINELVTHKPLQYVLGEAAFYGLTLKVTPSTLIPRPETEELVAWIIDSNQVQAPAILDIGTGSGCIAISLAKHINGATVLALDISAGAIATARQNAGLNQVKLKLVQADIISYATDNQFDVIVSNPPYVTQAEKKFMQPNVLQFEPAQALFVEDSKPLVFYETISHFAAKSLCAQGFLYFEINERYGQETLRLLQQQGFVNCQLRKDLFGKDRMVRGQKNKYRNPNIIFFLSIAQFFFIVSSFL